jgi:hypothetical protein
MRTEIYGGIYGGAEIYRGVYGAEELKVFMEPADKKGPVVSGKGGELPSRCAHGCGRVSFEDTIPNTSWISTNRLRYRTITASR